METVSFRCDPDFKLAVDLEIRRRRSTLQREAAEALSKHFGIPYPNESGQVEDEDDA